MVHAGHIPDAVTGARAVPIYQTTSFVFEDAEQAAQLFELKQYGNIYTRISNPTTAVFEERMASLEGATGGGGDGERHGGAAGHLPDAPAARGRDRGLVAALRRLDHPAGPHAEEVLDRRAVRRSVSDLGTGRRRSRRRRRRSTGRRSATRGAPSSTSSASPRSHPRGIPLIVDSTMATPALCRPIEHGATLVVHSATKFIGGHGTAIGGVLLDSGKFDFSRFPSIAAPSPAYHDLRFFDTFGHYGFLMKARAETVRDTGACLSPFNAFLLIQGLETLSLRMERQSASALRVARFLEGHPRWPGSPMRGLPSHPDHALAQKYLPKGPGAVFSFGLKAAPGEDGRAAGRKFIEALQLFSHLANIGDVRSLVIHPASTTHQQLSDEELPRGASAPSSSAFRSASKTWRTSYGTWTRRCLRRHAELGAHPEQQRLYQDPLVIQRLLREAARSPSSAVHRSRSARAGSWPATSRRRATASSP
jgi:O-acetylhomoserine (thiol)-lyase